MQKVQSLETALKNCFQFVCALEKEASSWQNISNADLAIDQLEKEYSQTKVPMLLLQTELHLFTVSWADYLPSSYFVKGHDPACDLTLVHPSQASFYLSRFQ